MDSFSLIGWFSSLFNPSIHQSVNPSIHQPDHKKRLTNECDHRSILSDGSDKDLAFKTSGTYGLNLERIDYGVANASKIFSGKPADAVALSANLLRRTIEVYSHYLPDFNALANSLEINEIGLILAEFQRVCVLDLSFPSRLFPFKVLIVRSCR